MGKGRKFVAHRFKIRCPWFSNPLPMVFQFVARRF